jgi:hypothetical protein
LSTKKEHEEVKEQQEPVKTKLERHYVDVKIGKYKLVNEVARLTHQLKKKEEYRDLKEAELFDVAVKMAMDETAKHDKKDK